VNELMRQGLIRFGGSGWDVKTGFEIRAEKERDAPWA
jgi:hypothetical protein